MGYGQTVASIARYAAVTAVSTIMLYSGASFVLNKQTPTGPSLGSPVLVLKTSSGGQVGIVDELGNMTLSGSYAARSTKNCSLVSTSSTGAIICSSVGAGISFASAENIYVNQKGDTMTGSLIIDGSMAVGLNVKQEAWVSSLHATGSITSLATISGSVVRGAQFSPTKIGGIIVGSGATVATGSGKTFFPVLKTMSGFLLYDAQMEVMTAGTTNITSLQVRNANKGNCKMFSTAISIDSAETSSLTAATPFVVNGSCNNVGGGERLLVDIPGVSATVPKVITLILYFYKP